MRIATVEQIRVLSNTGFTGTHIGNFINRRAFVLRVSERMIRVYLHGLSRSPYCIRVMYGTIISSDGNRYREGWLKLVIRI